MLELTFEAIFRPKIPHVLQILTNMVSINIHVDVHTRSKYIAQRLPQKQNSDWLDHIEIDLVILQTPHVNAAVYMCRSPTKPQWARCLILVLVTEKEWLLSELKWELKIHILMQQCLCQFMKWYMSDDSRMCNLEKVVSPKSGLTDWLLQTYKCTLIGWATYTFQNAHVQFGSAKKWSALNPTCSTGCYRHINALSWLSYIPTMHTHIQCTHLVSLCCSPLRHVRRTQLLPLHCKETSHSPGCS